MISKDKIERVFEIIDREMSFIDTRDIKPERKRRVLSNWQFVRDVFREVCIDCAQAEGLITAEQIKEKERSWIERKL